MNNPACAHLIIKWNTQEVDGLTHGWWACEMCRTLFVPQTVERLEQQRLQQVEAYQKTRTALESANNLCRSAFSIAQRKGSQTNWDSFIEQLKESLKIQHSVMYPEGRVVFPQPSPSPEQIKEAEESK